MIIDVCIELGPLNDLKRKEAIASLVAYAKVPDEVRLFIVLQPQILKLLHQSQEKVELFQILALILNQLSKRNSVLMQEKILTELFLPLTKLTEKNECPFDGEELISCVLLLHKLFIEVLPPSADLISHLENVINPLFEISILPPTCHIKSKAKSLLERYLNHLETENYVSTILSVIGLKNNDKIPKINPDLKLVPKLNSINVEYQNSKDDWSKIDEEKIKLLIHILEKAKHDGLVVNFIESLVSYIDFTIFNNIEMKSASSLFTDSDINEIKFERFRSLVFVVGVISSASENEELIAKIFYDLKSALSIVKILLETQHQECLDLELSQMKDSFLISCVMLLSGYITTLFQNGKLRNENWDQFKDIVQCLKSLTTNSKNSSLVAISQQLLNIILTHGVISSTGDELPFEASKSKSSENSTLVEDLDRTKSSKTKIIQDDQGKTSDYKKTLLELYSPHIPIRGHALISLNKLIEKGDKETIENADSLLPLLEYYLKDDDTYIYLASVKALSSLGSTFPEKIVTTLTKEFSLMKHKPETRMKIMEILTETARRLGKLLPTYKNLFLNCVINGIKEEDKVKRAAVLLITLLLQGLGKDSIKVLHSLILEIYRGLKRLILNSNDPVIVTHAELAMDEINEATKEFLLPKLNLTKKIYITEVPPNSF
ncbi:Transport and Golgi organization protein 6-like protein [Armadillidium vulgare]|nr:Transport and Golgi organization protein 6-like protein [Armadillidium vulgare]